MITITPNVPPPNLGTQMRFQAPNPNLRVPPPGRPQFFQPFRAYRQGGTGPVIFDPEFDGKRLRKSAMRKTVDYNSAIIKMLEGRVWQRDFRDRYGLHPDAMYTPDLLPPSAYEENPINAVTTKFVKTATNKMRCPIFCMAWTPEGRRLVTGASSGEFTLWNGLTFNFETILQAHDTPVRTMVWSHNEMWMVTADHSGYVKYWQSNMNNVKMFMAHQEPIRGISFSPSDSKFASCSDDGTVKIWDFYRCAEERTLRGHGADVKCVHWHPHKGLIISGSKDNQQPVKLWDPKTGNPLATIHAHKSTVMDIKWNNNGNWFVTASRDHLLKLFDIRNLNNEVQVFRGHKKESSSVAWHPVHEGLFCSGGSDGAILFWHVGADKEVGVIEQAHDSIVWTLAWHPMGHILCSGSNDHTSKFWTRNRPGDSMKDKYNLNTLPPGADGSCDAEMGEELMSTIPGMGPDDKVDLDISILQSGVSTSAIPGLEDISDIINEEKNKAQAKKVPYSKPIPKNFQAQWNDTVIIDSDEDSKEAIDPIALLNQILEHQPGVKPVSDLEPEALYIYGKVIKVERGSALSEAIAEGGEKLMKYVHSGAIKELQDVIPHYEAEDGQSMPYIIHDVDPIAIKKSEKEIAALFPSLCELIPGIETVPPPSEEEVTIVEAPPPPMIKGPQHYRLGNMGPQLQQEENAMDLDDSSSSLTFSKDSFKRDTYRGGTNFSNKQFNSYRTDFKDSVYQRDNFRGESNFRDMYREDNNSRDNQFRNEGRKDEGFRDGDGMGSMGADNRGYMENQPGGNFRRDSFEDKNYRNMDSGSGNYRNMEGGMSMRQEGMFRRSDFRGPDNYRSNENFHGEEDDYRDNNDMSFRDNDKFRRNDDYRNEDSGKFRNKEGDGFRGGGGGGGFRGGGSYRGKDNKFSGGDRRWDDYSDSQDDQWSEDGRSWDDSPGGFNRNRRSMRGNGGGRGKRGNTRWPRRRGRK